MRIAICGKAGSGKTTIANHLIDKYGFWKYSFAAAIKELARELFGMEDKDRTLLQGIGQSMRDIDSEVWVRYLMNSIEANDADNVVIDDLRYPNEALWCRAHGFHIVKLVGRERKMTKAQRNHPSETGVDEIVPDSMIDSTGSIEQATVQMDRIVMKLTLDALQMSKEYFEAAKRKSNTNYLRGRAFEYRTMRFLREHGWHCMRKFGSKNDKYRMKDGSTLDVPLDLTAYKDGYYLLISCKYSIGHVTTYLNDPLWKNLVQYATFFGDKAIPVLAGVNTKRHLYLTDLRSCGPLSFFARKVKEYGAKKESKVEETQMKRLLDMAWTAAEKMKVQYDYAEKRIVETAGTKDERYWSSTTAKWIGEMVKLINIINRLLKSAGDTATEDDITTMLERHDKMVKEIGGSTEDQL